MSVFVELAPPEELAQELVSFFAKILHTPTEGETLSSSSSTTTTTPATPEGDASSTSTTSTTSTPVTTPVDAEFLAAGTALIAAKDFTGLLTKLVGQQPALFAKASEKEIENCLNLISALIRKLDEKTKLDLISALVSFISSDSTDRPLLRLRLLSNLYNLLEPSQFRYEVFLALLKYADESGNADAVIAQLDKLEGWIKQTGATVEQSRPLYLLIRKIFQQSQQPIKAHDFLVKYLGTYTDEASFDHALDNAKLAAVEAIRLPEIVQMDHLLRVPAVKHLEKSQPLLFTLLRLFSQDSLDSLHAFHKANPEFLSSVGLVYEECLTKMRLLSLATLGAEQQEVPYALISSTLSIDEAEVEGWIVQAISTGILDAKMDQISRVVVINSGTQRVFTQRQWEQLYHNLSEWRNNTNNLLSVITARHAAGASAGDKPHHYHHQHHQQRHQHHQKQHGGGGNQRRNNNNKQHN